jgi:hypothetical protein
MITNDPRDGVTRGVKRLACHAHLPPFTGHILPYWIWPLLDRRAEPQRRLLGRFRVPWSSKASALSGQPYHVFALLRGH